jgi:Fe-S cluster assembly protein SufD
VDGRVRADLATPDAGLAQMLTIGTPARPEPPEPAFDLAGDGRLGLIATAFAPEPLTLKVAAGLKLELISLSSGSAGAGYLQLDIEVLPEARLELVERHLGIATTPALGCVQVRLGLGAGATVTHQRLLASAPDSVFIDSLSARLGANAHYAVNQVSVGASTARSSAQVRLQGHGATLQWHALAAAHGRQVNDALLSVLHEATATRTEQMFRGIASDSARVACNSDVVVAATAAGTKVAQSLRGLIDGDGAEVDLRPRLTIHTDDIQASHGATTGRLDEDLLFYLLSRGLAADEARALLKWAFLGEVLKSVEPAPLRRAAELATATRLRDAPAAELLQ